MLLPTLFLMMDYGMIIQTLIVYDITRGMKKYTTRDGRQEVSAWGR